MKALTAPCPALRNRSTSTKIFCAASRVSKSTEFKEDHTDHIPFAKMIVKKRPEIVSLKAEEFIQPGTEGRGLSGTP